MNLNCRVCGGLFTHDSADLCAGCSRPEHKTCGYYEPVYRAGEIYIYFFCTNCNTYEDEWEAQ